MFGSRISLDVSFAFLYVSCLVEVLLLPSTSLRDDLPDLIRSQCSTPALDCGLRSEVGQEVYLLLVHSMRHTQTLTGPYRDGEFVSCCLCSEDDELVQLGGGVSF